MLFCCISCSSVPWWTMLAPSGGPPLSPISGNYRYFNRSVFALLPMHFGTMETGKFKMILKSHTLLTISDLYLRFDSKLADVRNPLNYAARQTFTLTERWLQSPKAGTSGSTTFPVYPQDGHVDTLNRAQMALFVYPDRFFRAFSSAVRQFPGYNTQRWGMARTLPSKVSPRILILNMTILSWNPRKPFSQSSVRP